MQDRYAGDVGDYIKIGLLRTLSAGRSLGVAWYRHPDQSHNSDGRHLTYLSDPQRWKEYDPELYSALGQLVSEDRSISAIESSGVLKATFHGAPLLRPKGCELTRAAHRTRWFAGACRALKKTEIVFADPDNGLVADASSGRILSRHAKQIQLSEALALASGRVGVFYHHNSRFKGGHNLEVEHWLRQLGGGSFAIRANAYGCRTFFVVNPDELTRSRATKFSERWATAKVSLQNLDQTM